MDFGILSMKHLLEWVSKAGRWKEIEKGMRDGGYMRAHLSSQKVESSWFGEIRQKSGCII